MERETSEFSIQKMAQLLKVRKHTGRTALFLGARTGGLFRSQLFYDSLQDFSLHDFSLLNTFERFAECYRVLIKPREFGETDIDSILTGALQGVSTIYADLCVAELLKQGIFDLIITTCIDDILEQALTSVELKELYDFSVFFPRNALNTQEKSIDRGGKFKLWKVFGDLGSRAYNITGRVSHVQAHADLRQILEETRTRDVLMVGFDPVWDGDLLHALFPRSPSLSSLWFVNDQKPEEGTQISQYLQNCQAKCIDGIEGSYENFFEDLHRQITGKMPIPFQVEQDLLRELRLIKADLQNIYSSQQALQKLVSDLLQVIALSRQDETERNKFTNNEN